LTPDLTSNPEVVAIVLAACRRGAELRLDTRGIQLRPRSALTDAECEFLLAHKADTPVVARELQWRIDAMRPQLPPAPQPIPLLLARPALRGKPDKDGLCLSCGSMFSFDPLSWLTRCPLCVIAEWIVLRDHPAQVLA
jgi:hypothetical protein